KARSFNPPRPRSNEGRNQRQTQKIRRHPVKRLLLLLLLTIAGIVSNVYAYTRITSSSGKTPKWASMPIPYFINESDAPDIVNKSDVSAVRAAFQTWQNVPGANVQFDYQGTTPENKTGKDGKNIVTFSDRSIALGPSVVAVTLSFFKDDGDAYKYEEA